jgi:hypothetical protein
MMKEFKTYVTTVGDRSKVLGVYKDINGSYYKRIFDTNRAAFEHGYNNGYKASEKSASYDQFTESQ